MKLIILNKFKIKMNIEFNYYKQMNPKKISSHIFLFRIKIKSNPFSFWEIQPQSDFTKDLSIKLAFYRFKNLGTNLYLCTEN